MRNQVNIIATKAGSFSTTYIDGKNPIITNVNGTFGSSIILTGEFSAHQSQHTHRIRGNPELANQPAFAGSSKYTHSNVDSYNGNGFCLAAEAPAVNGYTGIGPEGGGSPRLSFNTPKDSMYVTGVIKVLNQHLSDTISPLESPQIKYLRIRNQVGDALMFKTVLWACDDDVTPYNLADFAHSPNFIGPSGYGTTTSAAQIISQNWIRFILYMKKSSAIGVRDGTTQMIQKPANLNTGLTYAFKESGNGDISINDGRTSNPTVKFRPSNYCSIVPPIGGNAVEKDCRPFDIEFAYYKRDGQSHTILYDEIRVSETPEGVWAHNLPTLTESLLNGKISDIPYTNRTTTQITLNTQSIAPFNTGENIYITVVNSNGAESTPVNLGVL